MKAVLQSIKPFYCQKIMDGEKLIEIRKSAPKLDVPFKAYIYETQGRKYPFGVSVETIAKHADDLYLDTRRGMPAVKIDSKHRPYFSYGRMKVIGEYICNNIDVYDFSTIQQEYHARVMNETVHDEFVSGSCVSYEDVYSYCIVGAIPNEIYGWYISNLKIYDKPKELNAFYNYCYSGCDKCEFRSWDYSYAGEFKEMICTVSNKKRLVRPPQSWCYVDELPHVAA